MPRRRVQFGWDKDKAASNLRKHGVSFDLARTVFEDPHLLTVADLDHSDSEERWFSVGFGSTDMIVSLVYLRAEIGAEITAIRIISARRATRNEVRQYEEGL